MNISNISTKMFPAFFPGFTCDAHKVGGGNATHFCFLGFDILLTSLYVKVLLMGSPVLPSMNFKIFHSVACQGGLQRPKTENHYLRRSI